MSYLPVDIERKGEGQLSWKDCLEAHLLRFVETSSPLSFGFFQRLSKAPPSLNVLEDQTRKEFELKQRLEAAGMSSSKDCWLLPRISCTFLRLSFELTRSYPFLVPTGKVLDDEKTVSEIDIKEKDFVVVMFAVSVFPSSSFPPLPFLSPSFHRLVRLSTFRSCSRVSLIVLLFRSIRKSSPLPKLLSQSSRLLLLLQLLPPPLPPPLLRMPLCRTSLPLLLLLLRFPLPLLESLFPLTARPRSVRLHLSLLAYFNLSSTPLPSPR